MSSRWVLYGYKVYNDIFEVIPDEAETVSRIFNEYMSGLSLKAIAERLTAEQVIYKPGKSEWNKNMVSRILENPHYAGDDDYPAIVVSDIYDAVISRKNALGGKREKDTPEIKYLKSVIFCSTCGKQIHRLAKYSNDHEKWLCENNCKVAVYMDDETLFGKIISIINKVISQPDLLRVKTTVDSELNIEALRKTNEVRYMLDQPNIQFNPIKKALFDCTESRFDSFAFDETTYTEPLIKYIGQQPKIDKIDVQLLSTVVRKIYINRDGSITICFMNGKQINSEKEEQ